MTTENELTVPWACSQCLYSKEIAGSGAAAGYSLWECQHEKAPSPPPTQAGEEGPIPKWCPLTGAATGVEGSVCGTCNATYPNHEEDCPWPKIAELESELADYKEALESKRKNIRAIDVALHGEAGAAKQASGCDLIGPAKAMRERAEAAEAGIKELKEEYYNANKALINRIITVCREKKEVEAKLEEIKEVRKGATP